MKMLFAAFTAMLLAGAAHAQAKSEAATVGNASNDHLLWLFAVTLLIVVGVAVWQLGVLRKAKRQGHHSALSDSARPQQFKQR